MNSVIGLLLTVVFVSGMGNVTQSCHAQYDAELIEFRKELSQFREMIVDDLDEYARTDIVLPRQYQKIESHLKLITNWPHSSFEQPLRLIGSRKYDRPIGWYLKRSLQTNGIHTKDLNKKNQEKANSLADQIREKTSFKVFEELLPPYVRGISLFAKLDFPDSMTIPIAVEALSNESLSIRVQAWVWLARLGIIAPSGSVIEGWLTFTLKHKTELEQIRFDIQYENKLFLLSIFLFLTFRLFPVFLYFDFLEISKNILFLTFRLFVE